MGFISPMNTLDNYAVIDPLYGVDGLRNVDEESDLNSISYERRRPGMIVGTDGGSKFFKLKNIFWSFELTDWEEIFFLNTTQLNFVQNLITNFVNPPSFVDRELMLGSIDGVNKEFKLQFTPELNSEHIYLNGLLQDQGENNDYTISGKIITFNISPQISSKITCSYRFF